MSVSGILLSVAVVCAFWAAVTAVLIASALGRRGIETPFPFLGLYIFRNLAKYRELTLAEAGKVGPLYYSYVVPINTALLLVLAGLVMLIRP